MSSYNSFNDNSQVVYDFSNKLTKGQFLSKVFGMMFVCLLVTTVVAAGVGIGFQTWLTNTMVGNEYDANVLTTLLGTLIVSAIALLIMSFVLPITFIRGRHNIIIPLMIYVVLMGIMLSAFVFLMDWVILVEAFGITTLIFGVMGLLGYVSKGRLAGIGMILMGLLIGAGLLSLVNWIMILIGGVKEGNVMISWVVSLMIFAFLMFVTLYDVNRIRRIAETGAQQDNNLINYCAFILYSDFIAILIRVIYFLSIVSRRR